MPKLSFAQTLAELQETVDAVRSNADILPSFLLLGADEIEAKIAELKELKGRQRVYAAELEATVEAKRSVMARGVETARYMRTVIKYMYGRKDARITRFGIRLRRRPRRKVGTELPAVAATMANAQTDVLDRRAERPAAGTPPEVIGIPVYLGVEALTAARIAVRMAHAARANSAAIGTEGPPNGGEAERMGEEAPPIGRTLVQVGRRSRRWGRSGRPLGRKRLGMGKTPLGFGGKLSAPGESI